MGKSSKKSATKVDVAPVAVTQSGKKGKRGAEKEIEKAVSAKKQKVERDETVVAKQKIEKKLPKKAASSSNSDDSSDDSDSDSDSEPKVVAKKTPVAAVKNGSVVAKKPKEDSSSDSSDSSESDSDDSDEKPAAKKQPTTAVKNGSAPAKKAPAPDSSSSESDSEDEEPAVVKNVAKKESSSSDSESDSESSDEEEEKKVAAPVAAAKAKAESSDSDSDEDSSDSDEEPKATQAKATPAKAVAKPTKADSSSSEESSDEDSSEDDEPAKAEPVKKVQAATKSESSSDDESSDDDSDDSDEGETDKQSLKTPKKKDTDVEMVDAEKSAGSTFQKTPKTPATPEATGSKTLFVGNLSFSIQEANVRDFFKDAGEVVDVRFASNAEGQFRGFGHVEFATAEAAQKAMELHDQPLLDRPVRLDLARERGDANKSAFTPQNREARGQTAFVRGFDTSQGEDEIRSALQQHFGSCGEITRISIPKDYESGTVKGICYMDFADSDGFNKALGMDGSDLGGGYLTVQEAKPRGDSVGGSGGRFDRGGSGGRRGGGRFGGRGGRDGGGRFSGGRGGRDGGRGRGGRGTPYNKPNMTPMGKKTTFDD